MSERPEYKCTFDKENPEIFSQHLFICNTCHFKEFEAVCESCSKLCHSGHLLTDLGYARGFCTCGRGSSACFCFCKHLTLPGIFDIPLSANRQCLYTLHGSSTTSIPLNACISCHMGGRDCICDPCRYICHHGHVLQNRGQGSGYCDCGDPENARFYHNCLLNHLSAPEDTSLDQKLKICTSLLFKDREVKQDAFYCLTCDPSKMTPVCKYCFENCHKHHANVSLSRDSRNMSFPFVCNCGTYKMGNGCAIMAAIEPAA